MDKLLKFIYDVTIFYIRINLMNTHDILLDAMTKLGYPSLKGICFSISIRLLEACFIYQGEEFLQLIDRIVAFGANLPSYVEEARAKKGTDLIERDKEVFDILAFFDGILLIQCQNTHYSFLNTRNNYQTKLKASSLLVEREKCTAQGGLVTIHSIPALFTEQELTDYLGKLTKAIEAEKVPEDCPLGLIIIAHGHAIALIYFPQGWMIMNINSYPPELIKKNNLQELAKQIKAAFTLFVMDKTSNFLDYNISLHTLGNKVPSLSKIVEKLNRIKQQILFEQKIANREIDGINLAYLATVFDHEHVITPYDIKQSLVNKKKLFNLAVVNNNGKIVLELLKMGVDVNQENDKGCTSAITAAVYGYRNIISILIEHRADFNKTTCSGHTPAYCAAAAGYDDIIEQLIKLRVNFNLACVFAPEALIEQTKGLGVLITARVAKFIAQKGTPIISVTPRDIAALMGHDKIVQMIDKHLEFTRITEMAISVISHYTAPDKAPGKAAVTFFTSCQDATERALGITKKEATSYSESALTLT